jgi:hypothetical protein
MTALPRVVAASILAALVAVTSALGDTGPREYAYLFFQGRVTDMVGTRPLSGATVRLASAGRVFEARTDPKGAFLFEKLPLGTYDVAITAPGGGPLQIVREVDPDDPVRTRFQVKSGQSDVRKARLRVENNRVVIDVPKPPTDWPKFWKQFGIFIGCAGLLAL